MHRPRVAPAIGGPSVSAVSRIAAARVDHRVHADCRQPWQQHRRCRRDGTGAGDVLDNATLIGITRLTDEEVFVINGNLVVS
jgi:hypothetical protein